MTSALGSVRLSEYGFDSVAVCNKPFKARNGKLRRTHKYYIHKLILFIIHFEGIVDIKNTVKVVKLMAKAASL